MGKKVEIPDYVLEKAKELYFKNYSMLQISKKLGYDWRVLIKRLREKLVSLEEVDIEEIMGREQAKIVYPIPEIKERFEVGMIVDLELNEKVKGKSPEKYKRLRIVGVCSSFISIERIVLGGIYKESISYRDIFSGYARVSVINKC